MVNKDVYNIKLFGSRLYKQFTYKSGDIVSAIVKVDTLVISIIAIDSRL